LGFPNHRAAGPPSEMRLAGYELSSRVCISPSRRDFLNFLDNGPAESDRDDHDPRDWHAVRTLAVVAVRLHRDDLRLRVTRRFRAAAHQRRSSFSSPASLHSSCSDSSPRAPASCSNPCSTPGPVTVARPAARFKFACWPPARGPSQPSGEARTTPSIHWHRDIMPGLPISMLMIRQGLGVAAA
jgi:hypothetical protein